MATREHVRGLEIKHASLDQRLLDLRFHPGAPDQELIELKKRKLALKDRIAQLQTNSERI